MLLYVIMETFVKEMNMNKFTYKMTFATKMMATLMKKGRRDDGSDDDFSDSYSMFHRTASSDQATKHIIAKENYQNIDLIETQMNS